MALPVILSRLGLSGHAGAGAPGHTLVSRNPATGEELGRVTAASEADYDAAVERSIEVFRTWRMRPAPQRGEIVRQIGQALREHKDGLGELVTLETGKILAEGKGEVQEMIDIADFAVGLSRQLHGLTMPSERPGHRMFEQWHPLGPVGVITAFNFPVAVWSWNALIAAVCGDTVVWKPSEITPLTALAVQRIVDPVLERNNAAGVFSLVTGGAEIGERMAADRRLPLVSATGSCRMGRQVARAVSERLGRSLLELGGNNAVIATSDANLDLAVHAIVFGAVGTAGQRCTSIRRLLVERPVAGEMTRRLISAYRQVRIGNPLEQGVLMGPLINGTAVERMFQALDEIRRQGGEVLYGGSRLPALGANFVEPVLVRSRAGMAVLNEEVFAPILHLIEFDTLDEAIGIHNAVPQGLSSAVFTTNLISAEAFLSARGSDCGIANVNIATSGAEIGGAFGGEKDTGGGRESGSDAWKAYMRRQTVTVNWSSELPLAQGIEFRLDGKS